MNLSAIDWAIMVVYFAFVLGHRRCPAAIDQDEHRLLPLRPLDPGLDHRAWPSSPPTSVRRKSSAWAPAVRNTAS